MAVTLAGEGLAVAAGPNTWTLTVPSGATGIVVGVHTTDFGVSATPTFGGLTLDTAIAVDEGGTFHPHIYIFWLADISGRSGSNLVVSGINTLYVEAAFIEGAAAELLDTGSDSGAGDCTATLDTGGSADAFGYVFGHCSATGGFGPYGSQTELSELGNAVNASYLEGIDGSQVLGTSGNHFAGGWMVAALFGGTDVVLLPSAFGEESGFLAGVEVAAFGPAMIYPSLTLGEESGFLAGVVVRGYGPRQVALVGERKDTSLMTEGGTEGDVLTFHEASPPDWQPPGGSSLTAATLMAFGIVGPILMSEGITDPPEPLWSEDGNDYLYGELHDP